MVMAVALLAAGGPGAAQDAADPELKALVAKLVGGDADAAKTAGDELARRGAAAVPPLVAALSDTTRRVPVLDVLRRIGPAAKDAVPTLTGFVRGPSTVWRPATVRTLAAIGADAAPAVTALAAIVAQPKAPERADAAAAVARIVVDVGLRTPRSTLPNAADRAIDAACGWLLRHRGEDEHWSCAHFDKRCTGGPPCVGAGYSGYDLGITALATLTLQVAERADAPERAKAVAAACAWMAKTPDEKGLLRPGEDLHWSYQHALAGIALARQYRRTRDEGLRVVLQRAVDETQRIRNRTFGGWRYSTTPEGDCDSSVTAWMVKFLHTAADAGLDVDASAIAGAVTYIENLTEPEKGFTGYQQKGGPSARTSEMQTQFPASLSAALPSCALIVRLGAGTPREDPIVRKQVERLLALRPRWSEVAGTIDLYYWLQGSAAMRMVGGRDYGTWREALLGALVPHQARPETPCAAGSWPPCDPWSPDGGRIYTTCAAALALASCSEDPAARPALPLAFKLPMQTLEKVATSDPDAAVRAAAHRAANLVRDAFR